MSAMSFLRQNCAWVLYLGFLKWQQAFEQAFSLNIYFRGVKARHICYILGYEFFVVEKKTSQNI